MSTILQQLRQKAAELAKTTPKTSRRDMTQPRNFPQVVETSYISQPVDIPNEFLQPLADPSTIKVEKVDFEKTPLPEYKGSIALVLDNVFSQGECDQLINMAERSAGAHTDDAEIENSGWKPAMVNAGRNREMLVLDYRNSDRIIWDQEEVARRIWKRVLQGTGVNDSLAVLSRKLQPDLLRSKRGGDGDQWLITDRGVNERLRFLKYGPGQYFKEHCDGTYETEDGSQRSFFTIHLYLNDSAQALGIPEDKDDRTSTLLRGGATMFHSRDLKREFPVDPKGGRVLIFQHRGLLHSGAEVISGIKYTMRSDLMYRFEKDASMEIDS